MATRSGIPWDTFSRDEVLALIKVVRMMVLPAWDRDGPFAEVLALHPHFADGGDIAILLAVLPPSERMDDDLQALEEVLLSGLTLVGYGTPTTVKAEYVR